jgi:hypothetical protein
MGEPKKALVVSTPEPVKIDSFAGPVEVYFDDQADCTPLGQLPFFIDFLKTTGFFEAWVKDCPLGYTSPNASDARDLLGTVMLSILCGHNRYAHISALRYESVNPGLLGMKKVVSEDAIRRAGIALATPEGMAWTERHLACTVMPLFDQPWILDVDASVKPLYGHQEGAVLGYNPKKPGRPCHALHSAMMAGTRLVCTVEMRPGNESASKHALGWLENWLESMPREKWPWLVRGDAGLGTDGMMCSCENKGQNYLFKLRRSAGVQKLAQRLFLEADWKAAGDGWSAAQAPLKLLGWDRERKVTVLRRATGKELAAEDAQGKLQFMSVKESAEVWEYVVLVCNLDLDPWAMSKLYRGRGDCENHFDELKNQWGWGGYVTRDLARSRLMTRIIALVYNWWTIYARLAGEGRHQEALTSRPELMSGVGRLSRHAGRKILRLSRLHAGSVKVIRRLRALANLFKMMTAEQLDASTRLTRLLLLAFRKLLATSPPFHPQLTINCRI